MTIFSFLSFSVSFGLLVISPGPGLFVIISRTIAGTSASGLLVVCGIVLIDFVFLAVAILGLSAVSAFLGPFFLIFKYVAAIYLIWIGFKIMRSVGVVKSVAQEKYHSVYENIMAGVLVTLGNPKPIIFYSALLPALVELDQFSVRVFLIVCALITVVSFFVYGLYILFIGHTRQFITSEKASRRINIAIGGCLMAIGVSFAFASTGLPV